MRISARSYPHPVVGNRDDVLGAAFQATIEMTADAENIYIETQVTSNSTTINNLISKEMAFYALHVECSNTLFRQVYQFFDSDFRVAIKSECLNDAVEVNVFVCASCPISGYSVDTSHPDYGPATFEIRKGDILALADGHVFYIESKFDSMSRIGSIMQIVESSEAGDVPMKVDMSGDKIVIFLSKSDFQDYRLIKNHDSISAPSTSAIVLPVLLEAIHQLKQSDEIDETSLRWMVLLDRKMQLLGLSSESDFLIVAQRLLELPIRRTLASSRQLLESEQ